MDDVAPPEAPEPARPAVPGGIVTRPSVGQLLGLAWPVVISRSAQVVVGFTDAAMCARLGESALAATTTGAANVFNVIVFFMGTTFIVSSFSSQLAGAGDYAGARRYGWYGLVVAAAAAVAGIAALPFIDVALAHLDYSADVRLLMTGYLRMRLLSCGFAVGLEALGNYYGGLGNTRLPMVAQVLAMVLNVALCWVLIYGHCGAPALGVTGSGLAATIATFIAFAFLLACFLAGIGQERAARPPAGAPSRRLSLGELGRMLRFGVPAGLNWFVEFAAFSFFMNVVVAGLGTTALAAVMAVLQLTSISFMPAFAVASAGAIFVGQALGAKKHDDVPRTVRLTMATAATWQGIVGLLCLAAPAAMLSIFVRDADTQRVFVEMGVRILMLSAAWQLFDAVSMVLAEALRAAGDTSFTFLARSAIAWLVFAPGAWVSARVVHAGDLVTVAWLVVYLALLAGVLALRFRTGRWRTLEITQG